MEITDEQYEEAFQGIIEWEKEIVDSFNKFKNEFFIPDEEVEQLMEECRLNGKSELVDKPSGTRQNESYNVITEVYVDQWSIGDGGDSFAGFIYAKVETNKWLKIPYQC